MLLLLLLGCLIWEQLLLLVDRFIHDVMCLCVVHASMCRSGGGGCIVCAALSFVLEEWSGLEWNERWNVALPVVDILLLSYTIGACAVVELR